MTINAFQQEGILQRFFCNKIYLPFQEIFQYTFTPNGDGINDVFRLKFLGRAANYHLEIFNRWGQRVFETRDPAAGWNGVLSGLEQPVGTYIWMVRWSSPDGVAHHNDGSVVLIR